MTKLIDVNPQLLSNFAEAVKRIPIEEPDHWIELPERDNRRPPLWMPQTCRQHAGGHGRDGMRIGVVVNTSISHVIGSLMRPWRSVLVNACASSGGNTSGAISSWTPARNSSRNWTALGVSYSGRPI